MPSFEFELEGFDELKELLQEGKFKRRFEKYVKEATTKNATIAEAKIKTAIAEGKYKPNAPMTTAIKGSTKPLVDKGELFKSITGEVKDWNEALVGVVKNVRRRNKAGKFTSGTVKIAKVLHYGATIKVTPKMRRFVAYMSRKEPGKWRPLKPQTRVIVIPARPFLEPALKETMTKKYQANWLAAVDKAMTRKS